MHQRGLALRQLGAADVMDRAELSAPGKPLAKERWAGVVDAVGSHTLANAKLLNPNRNTRGDRAWRNSSMRPRETT